MQQRASPLDPPRQLAAPCGFCRADCLGELVSIAEQRPDERRVFGRRLFFAPALSVSYASHRSSPPYLEHRRKADDSTSPAFRFWESRGTPPRAPPRQHRVTVEPELATLALDRRREALELEQVRIAGSNARRPRERANVSAGDPLGERAQVFVRALDRYR